MSILPSNLSAGIFNRIMLLMLPGSLVVIPLLINIYYYFLSRPCKFNLPDDVNWNNLLYFSLFILIFLVGIILEDVGSRIELIIDERLKDKKTNQENWYKYLGDKCEHDNAKIVHKLIENISFRFQMELSLIPAFWFLSFFWVGLYMQEISIISCNLFWILLLVFLGISGYLFYEAKSSAEFLNKIRKEYLKPFYKS